MLEILPGEEGLELSNTIAIACKVHADKPDKLLAMSSEGINTALAGTFDESDLYYMDSILCSTGWNDNDEVFDPEETFKAKDSPKNKPLNIGHIPRIVVGHIINSEVIDTSTNEIIPNKSETIPTDFNILTKSVIYQQLGLNIDDEYNKEIKQLIAEIKNGDWFVSMECIFGNFDYALLGPNGEQRIIKRDKNSSFLTKKLRAYGGDGMYEGWKVGRLPRDFIFSGHGLTKNPANKKSVILSHISSFRGINTDVGLILSENKMSKELETQNEALTKEVASLKVELATANETVKKLETNLDNANANIKSLTEEKTTIVASQTETNTALESVKAELELAKADVIKANERAETAEAELNTIKANALKESRLSQIKANSVLSDDEIKEIEGDLVSMTESSFNALIRVATKAKVAKAEETEAATETEAEVENATAEIDSATEESTATATASTAEDHTSLQVALASLLEKTIKPNKKSGGK